MNLRQEDFDMIVAKHMDNAMEKYVVSKYSEWSQLMGDMDKKMTLRMDNITERIDELQAATLTAEEKQLMTKLAASLTGADAVGKVISWLAKTIVAVGTIGAAIMWLIKH
jgi:fructose-1,6-bisphosphatase